MHEVITAKPELLSHATGFILVLAEDHEDSLLWRWSSHGIYSASSIYRIMILDGKVSWGFMEVWDSFAPSNVKIFSYLLIKNRILTHD